MDDRRDGDDEGTIMPIAPGAYAHGMRRCTSCWVAYNSETGHLFDRGHMPVPLIQAGGRS